MSPVEYRIVRQTASDLPEYAGVPISFQVAHRMELTSVGNHGSGSSFRVQAVDAPYEKDYDAIDGCRPTDWPARWDVSRWWIAACFSGDERVGGAAVAFDTPGMEILEGRRDVGVLWDIRVRPDVRRQGAGAQLFRAAAAWAKSAGCRRLVVETQTINVPACRFYARQGCVLGSIERHAYPEFPGEIRLLWHKNLRAG